MITFSFRPIRSSVLPRTAASVRTRTVFWAEAAERKDSVVSAASVMPWMTASAVPGCGSRSFSSPDSGSSKVIF